MILYIQKVFIIFDMDEMEKKTSLSDQEGGRIVPAVYYYFPNQGVFIFIMQLW